jgi:hypothetical protein
MYKFKDGRRLNNFDHEGGYWNGCGQTIIFTLVGIWIALFVWGALLKPLLGPNLTTFSCIRGKSSHFACELVSSGIFGTYKTLIPSEQIQSTEVEVSCDADGCSYQVILKTTTRKIPVFPNSYNNESEAQEAVAGINTFMTDVTQKSLMLRKDDRWLIIYPVIIWGVIILSFSSFILRLIKFW